jgi:hypothetical protein
VGNSRDPLFGTCVPIGDPPSRAKRGPDRRFRPRGQLQVLPPRPVLCDATWRVRPAISCVLQPHLALAGRSRALADAGIGVAGWGRTECGAIPLRSAKGRTCPSLRRVSSSGSIRKKTHQSRASIARNRRWFQTHPSRLILLHALFVAAKMKNCLQGTLEKPKHKGN